MINHRKKQNYRFRTWKFRDRYHLKGGVRQGCFLSLILNNLIHYIHFHRLYITSHYYAKFKENPCVGTDARPPFKLMADLMKTPGHADLWQGKNQQHVEKIIPERMFLVGLQCVIVVFPDHTYLLLLLLVKLYTRKTDWKTWCSCSMQKVTLLE